MGSTMSIQSIFNIEDEEEKQLKRRQTLADIKRRQQSQTNTIIGTGSTKSRASRGGSERRKDSRHSTADLEEEKESSKPEIAISGSPLIPLGSSFGYSPVGLKNIGNTCFMASILQCIFATAPLTEYFLQKFSDEKKQRPCRMAESYYDLLRKARKSKGGVITPSDLKSQVSRVARQFSGYG
jgi:hypothetical protein